MRLFVTLLGKIAEVFYFLKFSANSLIFIMEIN